MVPRGTFFFCTFDFFFFFFFTRVIYLDLSLQDNHYFVAPWYIHYLNILAIFFLHLTLVVPA
jgi:hypothetical protein